MQSKLDEAKDKQINREIAIYRFCSELADPRRALKFNYPELSKEFFNYGIINFLYEYAFVEEE